MNKYPRTQKWITFCDRAMVFSFCALIYFLPISIALNESFVGIAFFFYLLKRGGMFSIQLRSCRASGKILSFWQRGILFLKSYKPIDDSLNRPIAVLLGVSLISVILTQYPSVSLKGFLGKVLQSAFIYFNFIECINSRKRLRIFLTIFFISSVLICTNGLFQHFTGKGFIRGNIYDGRMASSLRQGNDLAAYLVIIVPVLFYVAILLGRGIQTVSKSGKKPVPGESPRRLSENRIFVQDKARNERKLRGVHVYVEDFFELSNAVMGEKTVPGQPPRKGFDFLYNPWVRILTGMMFLVTVICFAWTYSRGAWIGFVGGMLILGVRNKKIFISSIVLLTIFLLCFFPALIKERGGDMVIKNMNDVMGHNNRLGYWDRAVAIIKDYPVFGSGVNTYSLVQQNYTVGWGGYPHNSYLQMTAETGIIGLFSFLWMLMVLFIKASQSLKKITPPSSNILLFGFLTGFLCFLIHSFFDTNFYSVQLSSLMWVIMGVIVAIQKIEFKENPF